MEAVAVGGDERGDVHCDAIRVQAVAATPERGGPCAAERRRHVQPWRKTRPQAIPAGRAASDALVMMVPRESRTAPDGLLFHAL